MTAPQKFTLLAKAVCVSWLLIGDLVINGQTDSPFSVKGVLKLVDRPPSATPIEALTVRIHPLLGGRDIDGRPDREGRFSLDQIQPGRYALVFSMPGRIESFTNGSGELSPDEFDLSGGNAGPLTLVISMKSADFLLTAVAIPAGHSDVVALLAPADAHLTLRESCYLNRLEGSQTTFRIVPPGKYRVFVLDARFQQEVAAYAPRFADFLKNEAVSVEVPDTGRTEATATYLSGEIITEAIRLRRGDLFHHPK